MMSSRDLKYSRKYNKSEKGKANRRKHQLAKYGLTEKSYSNLYIKQNGKCAICETKLEKCGINTCIDHDHMTNKVRGVLCRMCNCGIGFFKDNPELMGKSVTYLLEKSDE